MSVLRSLLLSGAAVLLGAWAAAADGGGSPIRNLAKGTLSGIQEAKEEVIKDQAAWEALWSKHATQTRTAGTCPEVDFRKEMVVLVTLGRRPTGGYAVEITHVEPSAGKLRISVVRRSPAPGRMAIQVLTAPFHIVAIPRSPLPAEFVDAAPSEPKRP